MSSSPVPKYPEQRANRHVKQRGEWVWLPSEPFEGERPELPDGLSDFAVRCWEWWWASPMAHMWTQAEWPTLLRLVSLTDQVMVGGRLQLKGVPASAITELSRLERQLGISEAGRRDYRWRVTEESEGRVLAAVSELKQSKRRADPRRAG